MQRTKRFLSVQDISCLGQCSNTVMLPLLSAAGIETVVLPTALLSTHTGGFPGYTFLDLSGEMEKILSHFATLGVRFDGFLSGYLASAAQMDLLQRLLPPLMREGALRVVDPVMGDEGAFYSIYNVDFVTRMRAFCRGADAITPNLTEACLLADVPYTGARPTEAALREILSRLAELDVRNILITGVLADETTISVVYRGEDGVTGRALAPYIPHRFHGTGDLFTGAFTGFLSRGVPLAAAAERAMRFLSHCIQDTLPEMEEHWYGLCFEGRLGELTEKGGT